MSENNKDYPIWPSLLMAIILGIFGIPLAILFFSVDSVLCTVIGVLFLLSPMMGFLLGPFVGCSSSDTIVSSNSVSSATPPPTSKKSKGLFESDTDKVKQDTYAKQKESLSILEDMVQMHSVNPKADLEEHYGWEHKIDYDQDVNDE